MSAIDRAMLEQLRQSPMSEQDWQQRLDAHQVFLDSATNARWGHWTLLEASGLPLAIWDSPGGAGEQLNLNFADLRGLDLAWACLSCAAFPGVMAEGVSFRSVTMTKGLLTDAFLDRADFSIAKLEATDFSRASLRGANFRKAILKRADFERCDLSGADFRGAKLDGTSFKDAILTDARGLESIDVA
jgi:uncharacterized protein YjbI with pentapeptide repeats